MTRISPKQFVLLDVGYVIDNILPQYMGEKRMSLGSRLGAIENAWTA